MLKLCLALSALAFGITVAGGAPQAALRSGGSVVLSQARGALPNAPCKQCLIYRTPNFGDTVTLNPQPLPPGNVAGRMLRR